MCQTCGTGRRMFTIWETVQDSWDWKKGVYSLLPNKPRLTRLRERACVCLPACFVSVCEWVCVCQCTHVSTFIAYCMKQTTNLNRHLIIKTINTQHDALLKQYSLLQNKSPAFKPKSQQNSLHMKHTPCTKDILTLPTVEACSLSTLCP